MSLLQNSQSRSGGGARLLNLQLTTGSTNSVPDAAVDLTTLEYVDSTGNFVTESFTTISNGSKTFISASSNIAAGTYILSASVFNTNLIRSGSGNIEFEVSQSPPPHPTSSQDIFVIEAARSGEAYVTLSGVFDLVSGGAAQVFSTFSRVDGTPAPITYTTGGEHANFVSVSISDSTASLFVGSSDVSESFFPGDEIRFAITGTI